MRNGNWQPDVNTALCLGIVVLADEGAYWTALESLETREDLEVGEPQGHRIPACATVAVGQDEALLADLAKLDGVAAVEVVFAQTLAEDGAA